MEHWRVGQQFEVDGYEVTITRMTPYADHGTQILRKDLPGWPAGMAVDWESVERLPDGSPRRLGRMIR
jgi:hypothetical protein